MWPLNENEFDTPGLRYQYQNSFTSISPKKACIGQALVECSANAALDSSKSDTTTQVTMTQRSLSVGSLSAAVGTNTGVIDTNITEQKHCSSSL